MGQGNRHRFQDQHAEEYCKSHYPLHKFELLTGAENDGARIAYAKPGYCKDDELHLVMNQHNIVQRVAVEAAHGGEVLPVLVAFKKRLDSGFDTVHAFPHPFLA